MRDTPLNITCFLLVAAITMEASEECSYAHMEAIVVSEFGPPTNMVLTTVPRPAPGAGEVLVRVMAAGVNPVDTYIRSGNYAVKPSLPCILLSLFSLLYTIATV